MSQDEDDINLDEDWDRSPPSTPQRGANQEQTERWVDTQEYEATPRSCRDLPSPNGPSADPVEDVRSDQSSESGQGFYSLYSQAPSQNDTVATEVTETTPARRRWFVGQGPDPFVGQGPDPFDYLPRRDSESTIGSVSSRSMAVSDYGNEERESAPGSSENHGHEHHHDGEPAGNSEDATQSRTYTWGVPDPSMDIPPVELPCEFAHINGCPERFRPGDWKTWIWHIEHVHFQNRFPDVCICWFCPTYFETDVTVPVDKSGGGHAGSRHKGKEKDKGKERDKERDSTQARRRINFEMRLSHIAGHIINEGYTLGHAQPDFDLLRFLDRHGLIEKGRFKQLMEYHEGHHRPQYARPDYVPREQLDQQERLSRQPHDQDREDRERRKHKEKGKDKDKRDKRR